VQEGVGNLTEKEDSLQTVNHLILRITSATGICARNIRNNLYGKTSIKTLHRILWNTHISMEIKEKYIW
jgi:hypothetical protein